MSTDLLTTSSEPESLASLPVLPMKNTVLFPYLFLPLSAGRPISLAAAEAALISEDKTFVVVAQREPGDRAAHAGRPLHGRHQGGRQEDGPVGCRNRAARPGTRAGDPRRLRSHPALPASPGPTAAAAEGRGSRGRGPSPRDPRADVAGDRARPDRERGQHRAAFGPGAGSADPRVPDRFDARLGCAERAGPARGAHPPRSPPAAP